MNAANTLVTDSRPFCPTDEHSLFYVSAGVPVDQAMAQASHLLACMESLTQKRGALDEYTEGVLLQSLSEMTRALVDACQPQDPDMLQHAQRRAIQAKAEALARVTPVKGKEPS